MSSSIKIPLSYVRSTNQGPSISKRRRPSFSLHLDIDLTRSFCAIYSQSTTPVLSPNSLDHPSPLITLPPSPITPVGMTNQRPLSLAENAPAFDFLAWSNPNALSTTSLDFSHPSAELEHYSFQSYSHKEHHVSLEYSRTSSTLNLSEQNIIGGQNYISSVPQTGADIEQRLSTCVGDDGSVRVAPRILRVLGPRSSSPRDGRVAPDSIVKHEQSPLSRALSVGSLGASVAHYRQLSARETREMKLGQRRRYYKCLMDKCDRLFSRKSNVENHIRTHLDDKPFICSLSTCKAAFVRKGDLLRHEEIHRPSRVHACIWKGTCGPDGRPVLSQQPPLS
ncbi:C2H2 transcription factor (Azf1), partial [Rhizoctonia solani]